MTHLNWNYDRLHLLLRAPIDAPVSLDFLSATPDGSSITAVGQQLVELFTAGEQRGRTSQGYVQSAAGERLRYVSHEESAENGRGILKVLQRDDVSGLEVATTMSAAPGVSAVTIEHTVTNAATAPIVLTALSSLTIRIGTEEDYADKLDLLWGESEWLAEGRWHEHPLRKVVPRLGLPLHAQNGRGRFSVTSHGAWSTGEFLPLGVLTDRTSRAALAWQIETSAGWHWELGQGLDGLYLSALGPTDTEHQFAARLAPGEQFASVPVTVAVSSAGRDGALAEMTGARRARRHLRAADAALPVIYNDFMNTLMGDPTTEKLLPLIEAAADAGAEYFCIDAGWFATDESWWNGVGEWREARGRFTNGLAEVINAIHASGMKSGLWLEPEVIGVTSPLADQLPREAFFSRFGERVIEDHRFHLDFRHPATWAHLDRTVDYLIETYGVSMFKLDYNINPGAGTDENTTAPGEGLLAHTRAYRDWILKMYERHPDLLIENCSSGAMRMDYNVLSVTHLQSTSDQQNFGLYPPIAASAPASVLPEQCGNWAYPSVEMNDEETAFCLAAGVAGRLYLSGFLNLLRDGQRDMVREAVELHKELRQTIATSSGRWPLGLPGWDDDVIALELEAADSCLAVVWSRGGATEVDLPYVEMEQIFPRTGAPWPATMNSFGAQLRVPAGRAARIFRVSR